MYTLVVITPPATEPVTVAELKSHLRLNDDSEDALLSGFITTARTMFEEATGRAVVSTGFRQHVPTLAAPVYLMKYPVISLNAVKYYDEAGALQTANPSTYYTDTISVPAQVWFDDYPDTSDTKKPVAYVEFTAGWATVPETVKTAIKLLAGHYYHNREAYTDSRLDELPQGFRAVCELYKTGLIGPWGM
jgi:uncharacterized phiE125 gp8 family phage protein